MKTILVPTGGGDSDDTVFATALLAGQPFSAHLEFFHVRLSSTKAAAWTPHADFARGRGLNSCLDWLQHRAETRAASAKQHFESFCTEQRLDIVDMPCVSASWREARDDATRRLIARARHPDLVVVSRAREPNGLPPDLLEQLLLRCGRPLLIAPRLKPRALTGTVLVCWKDTPEVARAVTAAMPLLRLADRVLVVGVADGPASSEEAVDDVAHHLMWHGVAAEACFLSRASNGVQETLFAFARSCRADLLVMGGYSRSRTRQLIFGGITQAVLEGADMPVFVLH